MSEILADLDTTIGSPEGDEYYVQVAGSSPSAWGKCGSSSCRLTMPLRFCERRRRAVLGLGRVNGANRRHTAIARHRADAS
jgi:hypothetical protein